MEEELQYYSDIVGLIDFKLMKTIKDDTFDDPKPKTKKQPNLNKKSRHNDSDVDDEAGPTAPKLKPNKDTYKKMRDMMKNKESDESADKRKKGKFESNNSNKPAKTFNNANKAGKKGEDSNDRFKKNGGKFERGGKFEKGNKFEKGGKKFEKGGKKFEKGKFNRK